MTTNDELVARIGAAGGAIRFDEFMDVALYGDHGFYTKGVGRAGRRGDFITAPEVGPLFGAVLARAFDQWWEAVGSPDDFAIYEVGAGPGTLARTVLASAPRCLRGDPQRYICVEISSAQRASHPDEVTSTAELPAGTSSGSSSGTLRGIVVANELLDNVPFRLLVNDGAWREAWVTHRDGSFLEILEPLDAATLARSPVPLPTAVPLGARLPWQERAADWVATTRARLSGRLVVFDYAVATTAELARRPWREWLRTYVAQGRGGHYLVHPGTQDITADVCLDQLVARVGEPDAQQTQAQFLQRWGIDELVDEGRRVWAAHAARPGLEALTMRSRISEFAALTDPAGMGAFSVVEYAGTAGP